MRRIGTEGNAGDLGPKHLSRSRIDYLVDKLGIVHSGVMISALIVGAEATTTEGTFVWTFTIMPLSTTIIFWEAAKVAILKIWTVGSHGRKGRVLITRVSRTPTRSN